MGTRVLELTASVLILASGIVGATAQDRMGPQPDPQQMQQMQPDSEDDESPPMIGQNRMRGRSMMREHMMGHGMMRGGGMGPPPVMMRMMFALMDADGDGSISLQEFQAAHERIFKGMDTNRDGKLTPEEIKAFIHGK